MKNLTYDIASFLGLGIKPMLLILSVLTGASIGIIELLDHYVWSPVALYGAISAMCLLDTATGIARALKTKDKDGHSSFETRKALTGFVKWLSYTIILAIVNVLIKHDPYLIILREVVFIPIVLILLASLIKNLTLLGWIDNAAGRWIYKNIDAYKNPKGTTDDTQPPVNDVDTPQNPT